MTDNRSYVICDLGTIAVVNSATLRAIMRALPFGERDSPVRGRRETP